MFVDTLPFPYYDMLVVNAFVEFEDFMYSVRRIEDGIRRGKIVDIGASTMQKKRLVPIDVFKQCSGKEKVKGSHIWHVISPSQIHHRMPKFPWSVFLCHRSLHENVIETLIQAIPGVIKRKELKCTTHFRCPMENCSSYWSKTMGFLSFSQDQEDLHIRKDMILMPDASTMGELEEIGRAHV